MAAPLSTSYSPNLTPKRKRDDLISEQYISASPSRNLVHLTKPIFSFQARYPAMANSVPEDGNSSPASRVVQKFRDLALVEEEEERQSGGGVTAASATSINKNNQGLHGMWGPSFSPEPAVFDFNGANRSSETTAGENTMHFLGGDMQVDDEDDNATRKRIKCCEGTPYQDITPDISAGPKGEDSANAAGPVQVDESGHLILQTTADPALVKVPRSGGSGRLHKSYPSINRLQDSKSRGRRRAGTPPVSSSRPKMESDPKTAGDEGEPEVVDPVRAALTWHEDEITVYDPEDKDDDRRGMDGIGFRPTPAVAYQREQMRRRQLAEYRRREENEARARRNQRRREQLGGGAEFERKHSIVRVRFSDAEPTTVVTT
ncbi:hypothetical protein DL766_010280 [Monosporascus sp. MC13-8B]|uniref:BZIP domain-containing protein n=1 Tax=Monosporascus cannonballus TaxID=155416 RepID=A0ABY0GWK9_9PEZI|nr:hypothetical protein DL762_009967 [Monosporascus cannonballus]RYO76685.1 hypothetical protein DL763_010264 [Monosporascus cannonballus]RYP01875.1 hypothetical protein DL766_010280 [Monosporascus sp. MC13-8B]